VRSAEFHGRVVRLARPPFTLRIPHSAFRTVGGDDPDWGTGSLRRPAAPPASGHERLRGPRARPDARARQRPLGRHVRAGHLRAATGSRELGADQALERHERPLHLVGFRARVRVRPRGRDLVRHGGERVGAVDRRREDVDQLGLLATRARVAVRRAQRDRDARRHRLHRDGRRHQAVVGPRGQLVRDHGLAGRSCGTASVGGSADREPVRARARRGAPWGRQLVGGPPARPRPLERWRANVDRVPDADALPAFVTGRRMREPCARARGRLGRPRVGRDGARPVPP